MTQKQNFLSKNTWIRAAHMLLFAILYQVAEIVLIAIIAIQFLLVLVTGEKNHQLLTFSKTLGEYIRQLIHYLTYNSETRPYPFGQWPA